MENSNEQSQGQTIKCPSCKEAIQLGAKKCKHCGADLRNWFVRHKVITGILIIIGIGIIGSAMGGNETKILLTARPPLTMYKRLSLLQM